MDAQATYPVSLAQESMWFLQALSGANDVYNETGGLALTGPLDPAALRDALVLVFRKNPAFCATFVLVDGEPRIRLRTPGPDELLEIQDLAELDGPEQERAREAAITAFAQRPMDLERGPLARFLLLRLAPEDHLLVGVVHHIISDRVTQTLLLTDIVGFYLALASGQQPEVEAPDQATLDVLLRDRVIADRERIETSFPDATDYWRGAVPAGLEELRLPFDHPRPAVRTGAGDYVPFTLDGETRAAVDALATRLGVTKFVVLLGMYALLLRRYSDSAVVPVQVAMNTRTPEQANDLGLFVNSIPVIADIDPDASVEDHLRQVNAALQGALVYRTFPFARVVEIVAPDRTGVNPLAQCSMTYSKHLAFDATFGQLRIRYVHVQRSGAKGDLALEILDHGDRFDGGLSYSTELFDAATIERAAGHFQTLLAEALADPRQPVREVGILAPAEREHLLVGLNQTAAPYDEHVTLARLFARQAARTPHAEALRFDGRSLTYRELDAAATRLAHVLAGLGVGPDQPVAVCLERSLEVVIAILAIHKAGGAYVPIDPDDPAERRAFTIADTGARLLLTFTRHLDGLQTEAAVLRLDDCPDWDSAPTTPVPLTAGPRDLAYVIFTSGSTGQPKGVEIEHRSVVNLLTWRQEAFPITSEDRLLLKTPYTFDPSVWQYFWPLVNGATLVLATPDGHRDLAYLARTVDEERITVTQFVPSMLAEFALATPPGGGRSLRQVSVGGEALTREQSDLFFERFPDCRLINTYGPAECTVESTFCVEEPGNTGVPTIGRPIANAAIYVLDSSLAACPDGVAGQLCIAGPLVGRGYRNRPERTEAAFRPNPYSDHPDFDRIYLSGDRARWLPSGELEFLGRSDDQVKIRGHRVELAEVEAQVAELPGVTDCAVVARKDNAGATMLVAYLVGERQGTPRELRDALAARLPSYMLPAAFVSVAALPRTRHDKLDVRALPAPDLAAQAHGATMVEPRNATEETLAAIWADVLGLAAVGIDDDFFLLGGHSLLATRLVTRAGEAFGVDIPVRALFDQPTVRGFAEALDHSAAGPAEPPIQRTDRDGPLPLSFAQQRLWFLDQFEPGNPAYNVPGAIDLHGEVSLDRLRVAVDRIVARNESLRTTFPSEQGEPRAVIADRLELPIPVHDTDEEGTTRILAALAVAPFDLAVGPLLRVEVIRRGPLDHTLVVVMHHIVSDEWSLQLFVAQLQAAYESDAALPPLDIDYVDFAVWQREWLRGDVLDRQLAYWRDALADAPRLELPTDRPRPETPSYRGESMVIRFDDELDEALHGLADAVDGTMYMTILGLLAIALGRTANSDDVVVGSVIAGRNHAGIEQVIGFFVNTLAMRVDLSEDPTFHELIRRLRTTTLDAAANQDVPFERVVDAVAPERDTSRQALFDVMFVHQNRPNRVIPPSGLTGGRRQIPVATAKFDLTVTTLESRKGFFVQVEWARDLFDRASIELFVEHLRRIAEQVCADPGRRISDLRMLTDAELAAIRGWNDTDTPYPEDQTVIGLFHDLARRCPDDVAVVFDGDGSSLTFRDLDIRAKALARVLRARGVGPGVPVALLLERSLELVVAIVGVLEAGGAYVPMSPELPAERVATILDDTQTTLLLTTSDVAVPPAPGVTVLRVDDLPAAPGLEAGPAPDPGTRPDDLAYVLYTSGSTGLPKGALIENRGVVNLITWHLRYGIGAGDVVLLKTPYDHDISVTELFIPLLLGARLVIAVPDGHRDPDYLADVVQRHGVTVLHFVPTMLREFVSAPGFAGCRTLAHVFCGGEALPHETVVDFTRDLPGAALHNMYGPTETTDYTTCWEADPADAAAIAPIGRPIANMRAYLADQWGGLVPVGTAGELWVAGAGMGRGYLRRPELTARAFTPNPFDDAYATVYHSGDVCRWRADGVMEFVRRIDGQVKVRGHRVETGEVEAVLAAFPAVELSAVVLREDSPGVHRLVAYLAGDPEELTAAVLRPWCTERLPEFAVPSLFVVLDALPRLPNGKIDRKALPAPVAGRADTQAPYVPPRTPTERILARVWAEVLGVEQVGADDNFFALGGDSILSIRVVAKARDAGLRVAVRSVFRYETVAALAAHIDAEPDEAILAEQGLVLGEFPLTPIQRWFLAQHLPRPSHVTQSLAVPMPAGRSPAEVADALAAVAAHHDVFRVRFGAGAVATDLPGGELWPLVEAGSIADLAGRLDIAAGPTAAAAVTGDRLLLVVHHLIVDGVSWRILLEDLATVLDGGALPPKTTSYQAWGRRLLRAAGDPALQREVPYWLAQLDAPRALEAEGANTEADARTVRVALDAARTEALLTTAHTAYRTRVDDLLLAALHRAVGAAVLGVDVESHGRTERFADMDLSRTVGWFTSLYPLSLQAPLGTDVGATVIAAKESLHAVPDRGVGYGILRWIAGLPELDRPTHPIAFNYLGRLAGADLDLGGSGERAPEQPRAHVLDINAAVIDDRLQVAFTCPQDSTALAERYLTELARIADHCSAVTEPVWTPSDFPLARAAGLTDSALDRLDPAGLQDIYPLTPLQQGMVFHSQVDPTSGDYVEQLAFTLDTTDPDEFERRWCDTLCRFDTFRTEIATAGLDSPLAVVRADGSRPVETQDWRDAHDDGRLALFMAEDRRRGLGLSRAPLWRLTRIRLSESTYRYVWTFHHVLLDGWSYARVLGAVLRAEDGASPAAPAAEVRDHAAWLARQDAAAATGFWRSALAGFTVPTRLSLPASRGDASGQRIVRTRITGAAADQLAACCRRTHSTPNTVVQGAWALLLSRYTGHDDIVFGTTTSGRPSDLPGADEVIGCLIITIPARIQVRPESSGESWLPEVQRAAAEARSFEFLGLTEIQAASEIPADTPLFSTILVFENFPLDALAGMDGSSLGVRDVDMTEQTNYPLTVVCAPVAGGGLEIRLQYDRAAFPDWAMEAMLEHLGRLVSGLCADPGAPLSAIAMLSAAEEDALRRWGRSADAAPAPRGSITDIVASWAAAAPEAPAVIADDATLSYAELDAAANRLAHHLIDRGARTGDLVGVCLDRGAPLLVALLGILRAGGAYLPLDPDDPDERLAFMVSDTGTSLIVTQAEHASRFREQATIVSIDTESGAIAERPALPPPVSVGASDVAYCLFTSGSTGTPKGVLVTHGGVVSLLHEPRWFDLEPGRPMLFASPLAFDASTLDIWGPLLNGAPCVVYPDRVPSMAGLRERIAAHGVDTVFLTTKLFNTVIDEDPDILAGVRQVLTGGEAASSRHWAAAVRALPGVRLLNAYGPTETCVIATAWSTPADYRVGDPIPIGRPVAGARVRVVAPDGSLVPVGVPGELLIGGAGVARGYLNRPDLDARAFPPDPEQPGARVYRTGDVVRWLPDGTLEYSGRSDDQVKIRGHRIELGEVAAVLEQCPSVRDVLVTSRRDAVGDTHLVAYVERSGEITPADLHAWSTEALPDFMWPSAFVVLDHFPVNRHGKIDRKALPEPDLAAQVAAAYRAPRTPTEEILVDLWADVLGRANIGIDDDFFALGGHSLLATRVVSRIATLFDRELPIRALFENPTVAELAAVLGAADRPAAPPIEPVDRGAPLPLSFAQERLWFLDQWAPGDPAYDIPAAVRLSGPLDVPALERAFDALVRRHESLRTTFPAVDGQPLQHISTDGSTPVHRALAATPDELQAILAAEAAWRFDLARGPLLRVTLVEQGPQEHVLIVTMHHVISDGWSMAVLVDELRALYQGQDLPPLPIQYADFAVWQRDWLRGGELERQTAFWTDRLAGTSNLDLPTDAARPSQPSHAGATVTRDLDPAATARLLALAAAEGATEFMALLAVVEVALARSANARDFVIGSIIAGRNAPGVEGLIGFFVNTLALPADVAGDPTFAELLRRVRATALGAYANQDVPFEVLVDALGVPRDTSRHPLFQVAYTHEALPPLPGSLGDVALEPLPVGSTTAKFDLNLTTRMRGDILQIEAEYATELFGESTVAALLARIERVLVAAGEGPGRRLSQLPVLSAEEERALTLDWNQTERAHPGWDGATLVTLLDEQVARTPQAPAVTADGTGVTLTYAELDARARSLAAVLRDFGVGPDAVVGVCLERHEDLVVAIVGILRAGGAYVPIDPTEPAERQAFTIADAAARVVVTHERHAASLPPEVPTVCLDQPLPVPGSPAAVAEPAPEHLAYVLYTSGSTGRPKGVQIEHRSIVNLLAWRQRDYPMGPGDTVFHKTPITFDPSVWQFLQPLLTGARLLLATPEGHRDPAYQVEAMARHEVTHTQFVPTLLDEILLQPGLARCTRLRHVSVGGEALGAATAKAFAAALPDVLLLNTYGPAECTIEATATEIRGSQPGTPPIGRPLDNVRVYVLDDALRPVPVGAPGELCIAGAGVMRGYLNRPEATATAFAEFHGQRIYRTGDLVRWLPTGELDFLGRGDGQVKIRGHRVETGEVASVLADAPGLAECAVIVRHDPPGDARLVAYVVGTDPAAEPDATALRRFCAERLPDYMVPAAFVALPALPTTKHGKLDLRALPAPSRALTTASAEPRTPAERLLAEIWADVLGLPSVGVDDNFFELGGDSILSIRIVHRATQAGLALTVQSIFTHQTIAALAAHVAWSERAVHAEQGRVTGPVPLTPIQSSFLRRRLPEPHWYDQSVLVPVPADVHVEELRAALNAVAEHHDALRLRYYVDHSGAARQEEADTAADRLWPLHSFAAGTDLPAATTDLLSSFDLAAGPLAAAGLFEGPQRRLFLAAHHLVVDTVSWRILLEDLQSALAGRPLPAKTTSFQHWAGRIAAFDPGDAELAYWRGVVATPAAPLPIAVAEGEDLERDMRTAQASLSPELTHALLTDAAAAYHTQVNDLLLAALQEVVSAWTGAPRVLIDLEGHGREELFDDCDVSRTVGWFTSVFPVALQAPAGCDPGTRIKAIKETLRSIPRRGIGFGILAERDPRLASDVRLGFNYLGQVEQSIDTAQATGPERAPAQPRAHAIDITAAVLGGRLRITVMGPGRAMDQVALTRLADDYAAALAALVDHCTHVERPGWTPSDFPLADLTQEQVDRLAAAEPDLSDIVALTPLQHGMLYHTLIEPAGGAYVEQLGFTVTTADPGAFEAAWMTTLGRHGLFRSRVSWDGLDAPVLVVRAGTARPLETMDWSRSRGEETRDRLLAWLDADRRRGFDLDQPPWRLTRITLRPGVFRYVWTFHHLLMDGWSNANLFAELAATYADRALGSGRPAAVGPEFRDYVAWLRKQDPAQAEEFWRESLGGFDSATSLDLPAPTDPPGQREVRVTLSRTRLEAAAAACRVTLNTLVQGAWAYVLHRYADTVDVTFGVTSSGRPETLPHADGIIGCLINTVPLRVRIDPDEPVSAFLARIQEAETRTRAFDYIALPAIARAAGLPADTELFSSILVFENASLGDIPQFPGLAVTDVDAHEQTNYPLTVVATPGESDLWVDLVYDGAHYGDEAMQRLGRHLRRALVGMAADPDAALDQVPLQGAAELERQLLAWNMTAVDFDDERTFPELVAAVAAIRPEAIAVVSDADDRSLTYAELVASASHLAGRLAGLGLGRGDVIALCLDRSPEMVIGILGIGMSGAAWTPVDPDYPRSRREFILADTGARAAVTVRRHRDLVAEVAHVLCLDEVPATAGPAAAPPSPDPDSVVHVIYTSGSTGKPKGVLVTHRNLTHFLLWQNNSPAAIPAGDLTLITTPFTFDALSDTLHAGLVAGATLVLAEPGAQRDPEQLADVIRRRGIRTCGLVPSQLLALLDQPDAAALTSLRAFLVGGEALTRSVVAATGRTWPDAVLVNLYGPTEATNTSTAWTCDPDDPRDPPIGRPIANMKAYLLDRRLRPVPLGAPGELCVAGAGVTDGYLGRPDRTADAFVPNPFGPGRLYRTGDRCRQRADGVIDYLGRADGQVKLRGNRIELSEIVNALLDHPAVADAAVVVREDQPGDQRLVAYVVSDTEEDLRGWCADRVPAYAIPSAVVAIDAIPHTRHGKVDPGALPAPELGRRVGPQGRAMPQTPTEITIAQIWTEVLGTGPVGADEGFYELGGHSLLAARVISRVNRALGTRLPVRTLLTNPTVRGLAAQADSGGIARDAYLLTLHEGPAGPPLVLLPAGGDLASYRTLADRISTQRPVWGLLGAGWERSGRAPATLADLIGTYAEEVRAAQGHGPYLVAGWSMGGLLALEVARTLRADGTEVRLALLDTYADALFRDADALEEWLGLLRSLGGAAFESVRRANAGLLVGYAPRPYAGPVDLFASADGEPAQRREDQQAAWRALAPDLRVHVVPGDHQTMLLTPNVDILARDLAKALARSQGSRR